MHTHTDSGMAVACKREGLRHDNFYSAALAGKIGYHDFEGITTDLAEQQRIVASLGDKPYLILRNHGLLAVGQHVPDALMSYWVLQRACDVQVAASAAGTLHGISAAARAQCVREAGPLEPAVCAAVYAALVRKLPRGATPYDA